MSRKTVVTAVGSASLLCFVYTVAFGIWSVGFVSELEAAVETQDLQRIQELAPSQLVSVLHLCMTVITLVLLVVYLKDLRKRARLGRASRLAWTIGFCTLAPLLYPAYFWLHFRYPRTQQG